MEAELDIIDIAACAVSHVPSSREGRKFIVADGVKGVYLSKLRRRITVERQTF